MAVDRSSYEMCMWKEEAVKEQQDYFELLGLGDSMCRRYKPSDYNNLKRNIGFALFGCPDKEPDEKSNDCTGYMDEKLNHINKIFRIIKKCVEKHGDSENICVNFLFVLGKAGDVSSIFPVIHIPQFHRVFEKKNDIFIDSCGRVYKGWQDYLDNNTMPECVLCYPKNGTYSAVNGIVEVEFGISPAGRTGMKVLQGFDVGGTVLGFGATGVLIAAACVPVAWPFVAGAVGTSVLTGGYAAGRSIQTLVDRGKHQESIGLANPVSRSCWLVIGGGLMNIVSGGAVAAAATTARVGSTMAVAGQVAVKSVAVGSCLFNALGVTDALANIIVKAVNKEDVTSLEIFQFTSAVLFFTSSVISTHQAMSVISSMGKNSSGRFMGDTKSFMKQISESVRASNVSERIPPVIVGCSPTLIGTTLYRVCSSVGRRLVELTKSMWNGLVSVYNYILKVGQILGNFWESWNKEISEVVDRICQACGVKDWSEIVARYCRGLAGLEHGHLREMAGTLIAEKRSLENCGIRAVPSQLTQVNSENSADAGTVSYINSESDILVNKETQTSVSYYDEVVNIHAKFVEQQTCRNPADFVGYMTFVCKFVKNKFQKEKSQYEKMWKIVKQYMNVEEFNKQYGISGNPNNHFLQEVFKEFKSENKCGFASLKLAYESQNACTSAQEERRQGFFDVDGVTFHPFYNKRGLASSGMLSKEEYCDMAADLTGQHVDKDSLHISDSGATAVILVNTGADVIMVHCWPEDGRVSGIATVLHSSL